MPLRTWHKRFYTKGSGASQKRAPDLDVLQQNETVVYLCNHVANASQELREAIDKQKQNMLTVMSFCFIGIITFISARSCYIQDKPAVWILLMVSLLFWLAAFSFALLVNPGKKYEVIPGETDKISFLPSLIEKADFRQSREKPFDADVCFMRKAILRLDPDESQDLRLLCDRELTSLFREKIAQCDDIEFFDYNYWLASIVHIYLAQSKHWSRIKKAYFAIRLLFVLSIACSMAAILIDFLIVV